MTEQYIESEFGNPAIDAYTALGPGQNTSDLDLVALRHWLNDCEGLPLDPAQQLILGWMYTEHAVGLAAARGAAVAKRNRKDPHPVEVVIDADFRAARDHIQAVIDNPESDELTLAQAYSARGSLPFWRFVVEPQYLSGKLARIEPFNILVNDLLNASNELLPVLDAGKVPEQAVRYCQALGIKLIVMHQVTGQELAIIDTPPRFNRYQPSDTGKDALMIDLRSRLFDYVRVGLPGDDDCMTVPPEPEIIGNIKDPQSLQLLRGLLAILNERKLESTTSTMVSSAATSTYNQIRALTRGKVFRSGRGHIISNLIPTLSWLLEAAGLDAEKAAPVPELEPVQTGTIDLREIKPEKLLSWYDHTPVSRLLTYSEAVSLHALASRFEGTDLYQKLNPKGLLTYSRIFLEIAGAVVSREPENANFCLERAERMLIDIREGLAGTDTLQGHEALVELARIDMMRIALEGSGISEVEADSLRGELTEQLSEALLANKRTKDQAMRASLRELTPLLLNSVFIMQYVHEPTCMAIPSLPRHRGTSDAPGWNVTVWPQVAEGIAVNDIRRLRIDNAAKQLMRQGGVVIVPMRIEGIRVDQPTIQKQLIADYREQDHSKRALAKWAGLIGEHFMTALQVFEASSTAQS